MSTQMIRQVDQTGLKTGQALTIILLLIAFIVGGGAWWLVAFVAVAQYLGALNAPFAPYRLFYRYVLRAMNVVQPDSQPDHPEPHQFAMLVGALFNTVATIAVLLNANILGWALVWVVIALANLNFCLGCWMYYRFNRLGMPGFQVSPLQEG